MEHSADMARNGVVTHQGSNGSLPDERARNVGMFAVRIGENVACDRSAMKAHEALMQSPDQRKNILDPTFTDLAVAVANSGKYLYVTELFARTLRDYPLDEARKLLADNVNRFRHQQGQPLLKLSDELSRDAQAHIDLQQKVDSLTPPLLVDVMSRELKRPVEVDVFTTGDLDSLPADVEQEAENAVGSLGVAYKRVRGTFCPNGCYLIALVFGAPDETNKQ